MYKWLCSSKISYDMIIYHFVKILNYDHSICTSYDSTCIYKSAVNHRNHFCFILRLIIFIVRLQSLKVIIIIYNVRISYEAFLKCSLNSSPWFEHGNWIRKTSKYQLLQLRKYRHRKLFPSWNLYNQLFWWIPLVLVCASLVKFRCHHCLALYKKVIQTSYLIFCNSDD